MVTVNSKNAVKLMVYTRAVDAASYPEGLAYSIHLAVSRDGKNYRPLNQNYGILFARASIREDDTICPKGVKNPWIIRMAGGKYGIIAERINEDGTADEESRGKVLLWVTEDFEEFGDERLIDLEEAKAAGYAPKESETAEKGFSSASCGIVRGNSIEIDNSLGDRIELRWNHIHNTEIRLPEEIRISSREELESLKAEAVYSDGSSAVKNVCWKTENIDFEKTGLYEIEGTVQNIQYKFPLACGYGDPVIFYWEGKWYFIATNDNLNDIGIYVRVSGDVAGLFSEGITEHLILDVDEKEDFVQTFWAPEFHVIGGGLYILFAVGGKIWGPQCYLMRLKRGGDITKAEDWEKPVRIRRRDGSCLTEDGITLDMTYLKAGDKSYMVWSYRRHIGTEADTGSMLYIASVDEKAPWQLTSEPVLLSRPLFGWENVSHTINNEGPHGFVKGDKVFLTYSGGASDSYTYVLGLLEAKTTDDLLKISSWKKSRTSVLSFYSVENEYGPGHNSFFQDELGNLMIAYHGETSLESNLRCDGIRRVHFDIQGRPVFDLSAERDLKPELRNVKVRAAVQNEKGISVIGNGE